MASPRARLGEGYLSAIGVLGEIPLTQPRLPRRPTCPLPQGERAQSLAPCVFAIVKLVVCIAKRPPAGRLRAHREAARSEAMVGTAREGARLAAQVRRRAFAHPTAALFEHLPFYSLKQHGTRHRGLAARRARVHAANMSLTRVQGRGECRVKASPMARLQKRKQAAVTTGSADHRHSPRDVFTLIRDLPGVPARRHRRPRDALGITTDLTPASGRQDHAISRPQQSRSSAHRETRCGSIAAIASPPRVS